MDFFSLFRRPKNSRQSSKPSKALAERHKARPGFEPLEDRMLMSANVISGFVYHDANNNGIFDPGETPIANAKVELLNSSNQVVGTTTSAANGYYQFTNDQTTNTTPMTVTQTVTIPVTSAGFDITKAINQFDPSLGTLTEVDITQNGSITSDIKVENQSTLTGATITGTVSGNIALNGGGVSLTSAVSNNAGTFNASAYDGTLDFGGTSGNDFGAQTATASTKSITLTGNQMTPFIGTGQMNFDENVQVNSAATGGGNLTANMTSTATATFTVVYKYTPSNPLQPGNYTIVETEQPFIPGTQTRFFDGKDAANGVVIPNSIGTDTIPVVLTNQDVPNNNFGEIMPVTLSGNVYFDANNNGQLDPGETGIGGTTINLTGTDYTGQSVTLTTTTGADGTYGFINLRPGTYTLKEVQPSGWLEGQDTLGSLSGTHSQDQFSNIVAPSGANGTNYNFGELKGASLAGFVYDDVNDNGVKDAGENGIGGVTVTLTGANDQGPVSLSTTTAADGSYSFNNLRAGTYTITESQPASWLDGKDTIGTPGGITSNDQFSNIVLGNGVQGANNNFGELQAASLAGTVYQDANNNGQIDAGESGIPGTTLTLTGTDDNGQSVNLLTTTAADGTYHFANLRPGTYALNETQPAGYLDGKDSLGTQGGILTNDHIASIALAQGINGINNNFGELLPDTLAGFVYSDSNNNGVKDAGEHGISGVALTLTGTNDLGAVSLNTTTAADGSYSFANLRPGIYSIQETQPASYQQGKNAIGSLGGTITGDLMSGIPLMQGQHGTDYDFGEINPTGLAGFVWHDVNDNGAMDAGESGISGVSLQLTGTTNTGVAVSRTTTTAADGSYDFDGLQPGTYNIAETQPASWLEGKDSLGSAGGTHSQDNFGNIILAEGTLGTNYNFGELKPGSLSGHVYEDDNNNGLIDGGEPGIGGATIKLSGTDAFGKSVTQTTTTAGDGSYSFANLVPGTYTLDEVQPAGYLDGKDTLGSLGGVQANDHFGNIVVNDSQSGTNYNFGEQIAADVYVQKSVTPTTSLPGATLTYTLTVGNKGPSTAQNVQLVDSLPAGEVFVSATAQGWTVSQTGNQLIFTENSLASGASSTITITAVAPLATGTYPNTATISTTTFDTDLTNNQSSATVTVQSPPPDAQTPPNQCFVQLFSFTNFGLLS